MEIQNINYDMDKIKLLENFLSQIEPTAENKELFEGIMEAFDAIRNWSFARDINGPIKYGGVYYGFTEKDDNIPKPARKKYGNMVMPDFPMGFAGGTGAGIRSMDSFGAGISP